MPRILPQTICVSFFETLHARLPIQRTLTIDNLADNLGVFRRRTSKKSVPCWSPTEYKTGDGITRGQDNVATVTALCLDFDDGRVTIDEARSAWRQWFHIIHTTWSHNDEAPRFRVVLPLLEPIPAPVWPLVWLAGLRLWEEMAPGAAGGPDRSCKDAGRIYYLPAWREDQPRFHSVGPFRRALDLTPRDDEQWWDDRRLELNPPKPAPPPIPAWVSYDRATAEFRKQLKTNCHLRARHGEDLGGVISSKGICRGLVCPKCQRKDVWFCVDGSRKSWAKCNHTESCAWEGPLWDLGATSTR